MAAIQLARDPGSKGHKNGLRCIRSTYQVGFALFNQLQGIKSGDNNPDVAIRKYWIKPEEIRFPGKLGKEAS